MNAAKLNDEMVEFVCKHITRSWKEAQRTGNWQLVRSYLLGAMMPLHPIHHFIALTDIMFLLHIVNSLKDESYNEILYHIGCHNEA